MHTTYDVRVYKALVYKGKTVTTYYARWKVAGRQFKRPFRVKSQADSFRSDLLAAARKGEAFYTTSGLPVSMKRADDAMTWFAFACDYVDSKWPRVAATTRRTIAEALTALTMSTFTSQRGMPSGELMRRALKRWAFNTARRDDPDQPDDVAAALAWAAANSRQVSALSDPAVLRRVLDGVATCLDGSPRAPSVVMRWRKIFNNAVEYAVERKLLVENPIPALKWKAPRTIRAVDRRSVPNPIQARTLLNAVREQQPSGPRLVAFYACLYFAGLRPEEAAGLTVADLALPTKGWGELHLGTARPFAGREWTDSGAARDERQLKQRAIGETRVVPTPPELTAILRKHLATFGVAEDGRLFVGERRREHLPSLTVTRVWARARRAVLAEPVLASPLAARPYDLRHAAVSTWLNAGVPPTQVAEWAGHSVEVLLKVYAKCIDGEAARLRSRIQDALGHDPES